MKEVFLAILGQIERPWVGLAIGLIGIALTIFYSRRKHSHRFSFDGYSELLISSTGGRLPHEVEITYRGQRVDLLSSTNVILWNSGEQPIKKTDLVDQDPLRIEFPEDQLILDARITKQSSLANEFRSSASADKKTVYFSFDFLNPQQGASIQILHTGCPAPPKIVKGTIVGVPKLTCARGGSAISPLTVLAEFGRYRSGPRKGLPLLGAKFVFAVGTIFGWMGFIAAILPIDIPTLVIQERIVLAIFGAAYGPLATFLYYYRIRPRYPKELGP